MSILKIASALPLVVGIACSTSGSQSKDHTGAMWSERKAAASQTSIQGTGSGSSQDSTFALAAGGSSDTGSSSSGSMGSGGSSSSTGSGSSDSAGSPGSTGGGAMGSGGSSESMGSSPEKGGSTGQGSAGTAGSSDTGSSAMGSGAATGAGEKAHPEDEWVKGKVSKISKSEITITPKGGETKTLKIAKETVVTVNGKDAKPSQVKQGQQVRASYTNQAGEDVATKIEVGKMRQGQRATGSGSHMKDHGGSSGMGGSTGGGSSGMGGSTGGGSDTGGTTGGPSGGSETK